MIIIILFIINFIFIIFILINIINFNLLNINNLIIINITNLPPKSCSMTTSNSISICFSTLWCRKYTAICSTSANILTKFIYIYLLDTIVKIAIRTNDSIDKSVNCTSPVEEIDDNALVPASSTTTSATSLVKLS